MEDSMEKKETCSYTFEDLKEIVHVLRSGDGCPWDRAQTHESLKPCVTEEAAELVSSIRIYGSTGNDENMREELGDVLLQVMLHSQIASEESRFTVETVIDGICRKMIRRHPHVFGNGRSSKYSSEEEIALLQPEPVVDTDSVVRNWDAIKKLEKDGKSWITSPMREIPIELPALIRAEKVLKKAEKHYGKTITGEETLQMAGQALAFLSEPHTEEENRAQVQALLLAAVNLSRQKQIHAEQALTDRLEELIEECEASGGLEALSK